jgi:transcriptional regulator with XRE-family HTH domain
MRLGIFGFPGTRTPAVAGAPIRRGLGSMDAHSFGARLRELRERAGLTQRGLADRSGVPQANIARWEQGIRTPLVVSVPPLAGALGVGVARLFEPPTTAEGRSRGRPRKAEPPEPQRPPGRKRRGN